MLALAIALPLLALAAIALFIFWFSDGDALPPRAPVRVSRIVRAMRTGDAPELVARIVDRFGTVFRLGMPTPSRYYVCADPDVALAILADPLSQKPEFPYSDWSAVTRGVPNVVSRSDLPEHEVSWARARNCAARAFSPKALPTLRAACQRGVSRWLAAELAPGADSAQPVHLCQPLWRLCTRVVCDALCGAELLSDVAVSELSSSLASAAAGASTTRWASVLAAVVPALRKPTAHAQAASEACLGVARSMVAAHRAARASAAPAERAGLDACLLGQLDASDEGTPIADEGSHGAELVGFLLASVPPLAAQLGWTLHDLACHPREQQALRMALRQARGEADAAAVLPLSHAIEESLRLHGALPNGAVRRIGRDYPLEGTPGLPARAEDAPGTRAGATFEPMPPPLREPPDAPQRHPPVTSAPDASAQTVGALLSRMPRMLPKGSLVQLPAYALDRSARCFSQPQEWRPARWREADGRLSGSTHADGLGASAHGATSAPSSPFPFGAGKHCCAGERLARCVLETAVAAIVGAFELTVAAPPATPGSTGCAGFARQPDGLRLTLTHARASVTADR